MGSQDCFLVASRLLRSVAGQSNTDTIEEHSWLRNKHLQHPEESHSWSVKRALLQVQASLTIQCLKMVPHFRNSPVILTLLSDKVAIVAIGVIVVIVIIIVAKIMVTILTIDLIVIMVITTIVIYSNNGDSGKNSSCEH